MTRPDLCPNCGASTTAHTGTYCHECGEPFAEKAQTFSITIKGEQHLWTVQAWSALTAEQVCTTLADLTGYRPDYLHDGGLEFDHLGYASIQPAAAGGWGGPPEFRVRSSDGRPMPRKARAR